VDPIETVRIIRALLAQMNTERDDSPEWRQHARDLAEHVTALDHWMSGGGFSPWAFEQ